MSSSALWSDHPASIARRERPPPLNGARGLSFLGHSPLGRMLLLPGRPNNSYEANRNERNDRSLHTFHCFHRDRKSTGAGACPKGEEPPKRLLSMTSLEQPICLYFGKQIFPCPLLVVKLPASLGAIDLRKSLHPFAIRRNGLSRVLHRKEHYQHKRYC